MTLFDARGCLTREGMAALTQAPAGRAPAEVAAHLAACPRCQDRLLAVERTPDGNRAARDRRPFRNLAVFAVGLLATLLLLGFTLATLNSR
jgi:hypothetical protein